MGGGAFCPLAEPSGPCSMVPLYQAELKALSGLKLESSTPGPKLHLYLLSSWTFWKKIVQGKSTLCGVHQTARVILGRKRGATKRPKEAWGYPGNPQLCGLGWLVPRTEAVQSLRCQKPPWPYLAMPWRLFSARDQAQFRHILGMCSFPTHRHWGLNPALISARP